MTERVVEKFKYITSLGLEIIGFLHLAYNPRPAASGCIMLGVKPDNFSASACNILLIFFIEVCNLTCPFDHIQTSEVCKTPYIPPGL